MKTDLNLFKMSTLMWLTLITIILTIGQAAAGERRFILYLKNGFNHDITFTVEMGNCYQGTGYADPSKLIHGPIPPGGRAQFVVALNQNHGCPDREGVFYIKTTDSRYQAGKGQSFLFNNTGFLGMREGSEEFSGHLSAKSAIDESYTWTIFKPLPVIEPMNNSLIRIRNITSRQYLTQAYNATTDDVRNVTVWPLPANKNNSFRWVMQDAGDGYWYLINLASGLALTLDNSGQNVSTWGRTRNKDPKQLWRFKRDKRSYLIINKASDQGLRQAYGGQDPSKKNVTVFPDQNFAGPGWSWRLEDGGKANLVQLTLKSVKAIKTSTGQDAGTEILFGAISAALTGGASALKKAGFKGARITAGEVIKAAGKELKDYAVGMGHEELSTRAKELSGIADQQDAFRDKLRNQNNTGGTASGLALDVLDAADQLEKATSLQNAFNVIYGESPDALNIKVNGYSIWPNGGRDNRKISSQQTLPIYIPYIFERSKRLAIQLVEYDYGSGDDSLGWVGFTEMELIKIGLLGKTRLYKDVLVRSDSEGSLYALTFYIGPIGMDVASIEILEQQNMRLAQERERKFQQEEKNRLNKAEVDRKMAQAAITPFAATLTILGSENGLSRIPLNRYSENPEKLLISPAIYLNVTFANGSKSNAHYHLQAPDNVIFDDTSGDLNDLIKLVYTPGPDGTEIPGQVTATGNGVGIAELKVSFRNRPGLSASIYVEIVDTRPAQQAIINPKAEFLNTWATQQRAGLSLPYRVDIFEISQIYSRCPSGCEMVYQNEDVLIVMGMPDYAQSDVSMAEIDKRVSDLFLPGYCRRDNKKDNAILSFAVGDKYGARIANTTFRPVDCEVAQTPAVNTPAPVATSNQTAELFNRLAAGNRAEINLPFTFDVFQMTQIYSICPSGCEQVYDQSGLYVIVSMPNNAVNDVSAEEINARVGQVLGGTYCAGDVKKGNGIMLFAILDMHGTNMTTVLFRPSDCPAQ